MRRGCDLSSHSVKTPELVPCMHSAQLYTCFVFLCHFPSGQFHVCHFLTSSQNKFIDLNTSWWIDKSRRRLLKCWQILKIYQNLFILLHIWPTGIYILWDMKPLVDWISVVPRSSSKSGLRYLSKNWGILQTTSKHNLHERTITKKLCTHMKKGLHKDVFTLYRTILKWLKKKLRSLL